MTEPLPAAPTETPDYVWGADAIAKEIGRSKRATFYLLAQGEIPAKRVGGRWVASRAKLRDAIIGECA